MEPFSPVTFNDHAGELWIVAILSLIYTACVAAARTYIKYNMFGFDDAMIAIAMVLNVGQSIAVFIGLDHGIGKFNSITPTEQLATSSKSALAAATLTLLALSFAKCSVLALILRIIGTRDGTSKTCCAGLMVLSAAWGVGSCVALLVNCRADALLALDNVEQCPSQETRWAIITAIDILTEVLSWALVVQLSWTVSMSFTCKCQVVMAFSFRLPLIALSAAHLSYFNKYPASHEPQFAITGSLLFQQTMIAWSLISATVPNLKNFLKSFSIGMGFPLPYDLTMYGSSNMYALRSLENNRSKATSSGARTTLVASTTTSALDHMDRDQGGRPHTWRPDGVSNQATAAHARGSNHQHNISEEDGGSRTGSQEMIINKQVAWDVAYEDRR